MKRGGSLGRSPFMYFCQSWRGAAWGHGHKTFSRFIRLEIPHTLPRFSSSLSLAGTTIQFAQFAARLLSKTRAVHTSASGLSSESELLATIYGKLSIFSCELGTEDTAGQQSAGQHSTDGSKPADETPKKSSYETSIAELATMCKCDCDSILRILDKLKKNSSAPKIWKSFQLALLEVAKADEIKAIQARIEKAQTQMTFYLCLASR
jgi:hypothetical protein